METNASLCPMCIRILPCYDEYKRVRYDLRHLYVRHDVMRALFLCDVWCHDHACLKHVACGRMPISSSFYLLSCYISLYYYCCANTRVYDWSPKSCLHPLGLTYPTMYYKGYD